MSELFIGILLKPQHSAISKLQRLQYFHKVCHMHRFVYFFENSGEAASKWENRKTEIFGALWREMILLYLPSETELIADFTQ